MNFKSDKTSCVVCSSEYIPAVAGVFRCSQCGLLFSGQKAGFGNAIQGMSTIAFRNYAIVGNALAKVIPLRGIKMLDVGAAEGGFTELMLHKGADSLGLEPDRDAAREALEKKLPIKLVDFESFDGVAKEYDVIVFNDVFEHMQDPELVLEKSCRLLRDSGFILINAPVSTGFIFRIVQIAARLGIESPYRRIWGKGLCSPHIYFYSENNLKILLEKYKFELVDKGRLITLATDGMYQRVRTTYSALPAFIISSIASLFALMSELFPADVKYLLFKKNE